MKPRILISAVCLLLAFPLPSAWAGEGHDHGDAGSSAANGNSPKRLPDGSVFLPKPAQRQIGVRTLQVATAELPRSLELAGKVVMDPNAGGKVQAVVAGRVTPGPKGLPLPGQKVSKGEVLAYVTPEAGGKGRSLAESRLLRLRELSDTVPRKVIEEAEAAVRNEQMRAPVAGVIASAHVVSGQVVDAREVLFEVVNPERLHIEALAFDLAVANDVAGGFIAVGERKVPLRLLGVTRSMRNQALPLTFSAEGGALSNLAVGQPVSVFVQTHSKVKGISVPTASLMKNPANQVIVWVKTGAERFDPRTVTVEPLDGVNVAVLSGLKPGERVVTIGATLVNQIR